MNTFSLYKNQLNIQKSAKSEDIDTNFGKK